MMRASGFNNIYTIKGIINVCALSHTTGVGSVWERRCFLNVIVGLIFKCISYTETHMHFPLKKLVDGNYILAYFTLFFS